MGEPARRGAVWTEDQRGGPGVSGRPRTSGRAPLRLVAEGGRLVPQVRTPPAVRQDPSEVRRDPVDVRQHPVAGAGPLRLTRRGRIVVTVAAVLAIGAASMALAGAAQATGHAQGSGVTKVVIRPGQSLWSVAESNDPNADTRQVIQQILQLNSLSGEQVRPGQTLWVPRG